MSTKRHLVSARF